MWNRSIILVGTLLALVVVSGCATKVYQGPTSGRGAEQQLAVSAAALSAVEQMTLNDLKGKKVHLRVTSLTPRGGGTESPEERFIKNLLTEELVQIGAKLTTVPEKADRVLSILLRAMGVDIIRRDLPPIYHHTTFRGLVDARYVVYEMSNGLTKRILHRGWARAEANYTEMYIFYIIGPIKEFERPTGQDLDPLSP